MYFKLIYINLYRKAVVFIYYYFQKPTSVAEKVPSEYKPRLFVTSALQQVKVDLTWDETDPKRREFFQKVFTDIDSVQDDIGDFLASASSESEGNNIVYYHYHKILYFKYLKK